MSDIFENWGVDDMIIIERGNTTYNRHYAGNGCFYEHGHNSFTDESGATIEALNVATNSTIENLQNDEVIIVDENGYFSRAGIGE